MTRACLLTLSPSPEPTGGEILNTLSGGASFYLHTPEHPRIIDPLRDLGIDKSRKMPDAYANGYR